MTPIDPQRKPDPEETDRELASGCYLFVAVQLLLTYLLIKLFAAALYGAPFWSFP